MIIAEALDIQAQLSVRQQQVGMDLDAIPPPQSVWLLPSG
jgi:hypothetical protein